MSDVVGHIFPNSPVRRGHVANTTGVGSLEVDSSAVVAVGCGVLIVFWSEFGFSANTYPTVLGCASSMQVVVVNIS